MNGEVEGRTALILYGTESGTAQDLAEELGRVTERCRFSTSTAELDNIPVSVLSSHTIAVFVISTTGQGEFPSNAKSFWTNLLKKKLSATFLQDLSFFLVGLGDTSYPKFNWAARKLGKRLKQLGAFEVIDSCEADEQAEDSTDGAFLAWLPLFRAALIEEFPLPDGLQPIPDEQPLPSKWILAPVPAVANGHALGQPNISEDDEEVQEGKKLSEEISTAHIDHDSRPIPDSFQVTLTENKRVTPFSHWQDVRLLALTTNQSITYLPGDALLITPKNFPEDVNTLIHLMDWTSIADIPITFTPTSKTPILTTYSPAPIPYLTLPSPSATTATTSALTLRTLLTSHLDILSIPRRSLFTILSRYTKDPTQRDRLLEFTLPQYLDEYYDYATRPRRSILEILQEFDSVKIPWWEAGNVFPLLRGRQFSIASGGELKRLSEDDEGRGRNGHGGGAGAGVGAGGGGGGGTKFELLIAIVQYKTIIKKVRQGICTRYLAALAEGSTLNVVLRTDARFSNNKAKRSPRGPQALQAAEGTLMPRLLIGAGTGIAPLRALIYHDIERGRTTGQHLPPTALFFGCRNRDKDFFFADEWAAHLPPFSKASTAGIGGFGLIPSFSRDQPTKIYLQDRLREKAEMVFDLIVRRGAMVVVCGSSGAMPRAVREALVDVLTSGRKSNGHGGGGEKEGDEEDGGVGEGNEGERGWTREEAERYLEGMERGRRYLQETW